jgi:uncharacterized protein
MSAFDGYAFSPAEFSGTARLFPVPGLVMFPHVMQPLHVFEPRYCDLLGDAARGDRLIAMPTLAPGWEQDYEGRPAVGPVACLGRIVASKSLDNGTYNVLLVGMRRVQLLRELPPAKTYREAEVKVFEDVYPTGQEVYERVLTRELHRAMGQILPGLPQAREQLEQLLRGEVSLGVLTDVIAYALDLSLAQKESLLAETNVYRRAELLLEYLMVAEGRCSTRAPAMATFPPSFSEN